MEFFIDDDSIEMQFQELFKKIFQFRNGEVHSEMEKYGLNYNKALGVSIVSLKTLANQYEKNHLLAQKLWGKGFRESRIVASLLEVPEEVTRQQLKRWIGEAESNELLEQMCMNLFILLPKLDSQLMLWCKSDDEKEQLCATITIGRLALVDKERSACLFENYLKHLPVNLTHPYLIKQLSRTLGKIARINDRLRQLVFANVIEMKKADVKWVEVLEELQAEFN